MTEDSVGAPRVGAADRDRPSAAIAGAIHDFGTAGLRLMLAITAAIATVGAVVAIVGVRAPWLVLEGVVLFGLAAAGVRRPDLAARLLRPRGRVALLSTVLALLGALDSSDQKVFATVSFPVIAVAAIVASPAWVAICVVVSTLGYVLGFVAQGHSLAWVIAGGGASNFANEVVDLVLWAMILLAVVTTLRRSLGGAASSLAGVRSGHRSLTPALAAAIRLQPIGLLGRADPAAVIASLTAAEREVLGLLAGGLAPKQAAHELGVKLSTVRTHIASAKRRTGARTLDQLVGLFVEGRSK